MTCSAHAVAVVAGDVASRSTPSNDPEPIASRMAGGQPRALGADFGLTRFGVSLAGRPGR